MLKLDAESRGNVIRTLAEIGAFRDDEGNKVKTWSIGIVVIVLFAIGVIAYTGAHHSEPSRADLVEQTCGNDPGKLAWILADGTVCCDLCNA